MVAGVERDKTEMHPAGMEEDVEENMGVVAADEDKERGVVVEEGGVVVEEGDVEWDREVAEKTRVAKEREPEKEKAKAIKPYVLHKPRD